MAQPIPASTLLHSFRRHLEAENRSERTLASYLQSVRQAEAFLAARGKRLEEASRADLEAFLDAGEELRGRLLDPPPVRGADEVGRQVQRAKQALGSRGLVAGDADHEAKLPQLLQAGARVRVQVVLV